MVGGYDPIAGPIFRRIRAQRLLLEYDDPRSGSFEPLACVPDDKIVVLGLLSTKHPHLNRWRSSSRAFGRRAATCRSSGWR